MVIKPVNEGSSIGISMAGTLAALEAGLAAAFALDNRVLVEEFIQGTEVTGGCWATPGFRPCPWWRSSRPAPTLFLITKPSTRPGPPRKIRPARLSPELTERAQAYALTAHQALGCRGYSRTDMMVRDQEDLCPGKPTPSPA